MLMCFSSVSRLCLVLQLVLVQSSPVMFLTLQSSRLNQPFVSSAADCVIMFYSSTGTFLFSSKTFLHIKPEQLCFSYFILKSNLMNNKRVTPFTFFLYFTCISRLPDTHLSILAAFSSTNPPPMSLFLSYDCMLRSEAKVNQIEYSCPLCPSFHPSLGLPSFPLRLQTGLLGVCVWLSHDVTHTHKLMFDLGEFHFSTFVQLRLIQTISIWM